MSTLGLIIDIVVVLLVALFGFIGYKKGFLKSLISLFSWIVCLLVAFFTAKYVASWINGIYDFSGLIGDKVAKSLQKENSYFSLAVSTFGTKENLINAGEAASSGFIEKLIKVIFNNSKVDMTSSKTVGAVIGDSVGEISMVLIAGLLVFIVLMILFKIIGKIFDKIASMRVIGGINKILGLAFGVLKAIVVIIAINLLIIALSHLPVVNKTITPLIQDHTKVEKVVHDKTDKMFNKYVVEGKVLEEWTKDFWKK
ncbi:MAG: CvpA family protein [Clostridia bacterium]|nr:CvpA family protein [Clostridia bacterium]